MRRQYSRIEGVFSDFSASLVAGDTAILLDDVRVEHLASLLRKGVVVRTPEVEQLDLALRQDAHGLEGLVRLAVVMDRRVLVQSSSISRDVKLAHIRKPKKPKESLEAKVHRLIEQDGLGVVEACRKVHCRASDYYIYRSKFKNRSYGR